MEKLESLLELQGKLWVLIIGIGLILFGIYQFNEIVAMEQAGDEVRLRRIFQYIYNFGGKYSILAIFEATGIIALVSGILQIRNKI